MLENIFDMLFRPQKFKGTFGEGLVQLFSKFHLDTKEYHFFHDILLETTNGTTQIDHIFVSEYGIFVIETKNMKGWIFGNPSQATWTQVIYGEKYKFQNPLRQNYKHIKTLEALLHVPEETLHSLVLFIGDAEFKTPMPENVGYTGDCMAYIKAKKISVFTHEQVQNIVQKIEMSRLENSRHARREHVKNLRKKHQNDDDGDKQRCPRCGATMVLRTAKRGANVGNQFWGCSSYPRCRYTKAVTS